ncbi:hypothetical protein AGJ34_10390 [Cronobacter dublinensis subsp. dublinensis]|nr:hypothetical protein [Cronobacter dublinensis subsp. dublinensis]EGT5668777.1 hypothetical protein [Cronobacter dublinensis subsp. dublinensis]EGT5673410.1 hypothetical protein [Cronobacter dublinensis subsp. dublinensis]EGT5678055.1 hypothetical protein [Cronobacter dublinensis subsp. dublinensis]EGT5685655.1 hypothetical protein [Cronobacter dublinensis subsp. dublinensis]
MFKRDGRFIRLVACPQRRAAQSSRCAGAGINKNASPRDWHFRSRMYTMKQKSYATADATSASRGTMTLAWLPLGP